MFNATPRPRYFREIETISKEAGWAPEPIWKGMEYLAPTGLSIPWPVAVPNAPHYRPTLLKCEMQCSGMEEPGLGEGTMVGSFDLPLPREGGRKFSRTALELLDFNLGCTPRI